MYLYYNCSPMRYFFMKNLSVFVVIFSLIFSACSKTVEVPLVLAEYSLGNGDSCTGAVVSGRYVVDTALTDLNTVTIMVDVQIAGPYWISTDAVNGISFSKVDAFTTTGLQSVVLVGEGIPASLDTSNFTLTALNGFGGSCTFSVAIVPGIPPTYFLTGFFDGIFKNFSDSAMATNSNIPGGSGVPGLDISGIDTIVNSIEKIDFGVNNATAVFPGIYTDTSAAQTYFDYHDAAGGIWSVNTSTQPSFTIVVKGVDGRDVQGSFSGTIRNQQGFGTDSIVITNGEFSAPLK